MARFWVADLHLGHEKVALIRGFNTVEEHDRTILKQLSVLTNSDQLWILGDISSGRPEGEERALNQLEHFKSFREKPELHLIAGNHDSVSSIHRDGFKRQFRWLEVFDSIQQFGRFKFNKQNILMSHFPFAGAGDGPGRGVERHSEFRLPRLDSPLMHGHTHQSKPHMEDPEGKGEDLQQFCVSWDVHRRFVTEKDVLAWTEKLNDQ